MSPKLAIDIALDAPADERTVLIDEDEFSCALEDPDARALHEEADAALERLERDGRSF